MKKTFLGALVLVLVMSACAEGVEVQGLGSQECSSKGPRTAGTQSPAGAGGSSSGSSGSGGSGTGAGDPIADAGPGGPDGAVLLDGSVAERAAAPAGSCSEGGCSSCGNGTRDGSEECDGKDVPVATCSSLG